MIGDDNNPLEDPGDDLYKNYNREKPHTYSIHKTFHVNWDDWLAKGWRKLFGKNRDDI
jgi:hypothetical protein